MNEQNNDKRANKLCLISLACAVGPWVLWRLLSKLLVSVEGGGAVAILGTLSNIFSALSGIGWLAAIVLMIYVRVKYPKNVFGIILMVLYILIIILVIAFIIFIVTICNGCMETITACDGFLYWNQ